MGGGRHRLSGETVRRQSCSRVMPLNGTSRPRDGGAVLVIFMRQGLPIRPRQEVPLSVLLSSENLGDNEM